MNWLAAIGLIMALCAAVWFAVAAWQAFPFGLAVGATCLVLLLIALVWEAVQED